MPVRRTADPHDIPFMGHRTSSINGKAVRIFRMGTAGTPGYQVHGNIEDARALYLCFPFT
ncbi:MAG: hypothetical protein ACM3S0_09045 [Acidobacteriota bacterium]